MKFIFLERRWKMWFVGKNPPNLALWFGRYGPLKFTNWWKWFDHILTTTHGILMFLDFLKMGEQDLQLSCWEKIHLKLVSWCNFEDQDFPFLANSNYRSTFYFWKFLVWLQILPWWCLTCYMDMNEPLQTISHLEIHKIRHSWPQLTMVDFLGFLVNWAMTDDFWAPNLWPKHFKRTPRSCEHVGPTLGPWLNGDCTCLIDWLISWSVWPNSSERLALGQKGQCNVMQWTMLMLWPNMRMYVQRVGANLRCYNRLRWTY